MLLCFTDLDGTLLNHDDYGYAAAVPTIRRLQALGMPVVPVTSKTRSEVEGLRRELGLGDPFVVENGSGIFWEWGDSRFAWDGQGEHDRAGDAAGQGLGKLCLGVDYATARAGLARLSEQLAGRQGQRGKPLRGFGDLAGEELLAATGLPAAELERACDREFSEPFLRPVGVDLGELGAIAADLGLHLLEGNRFCHLLGAGADKGRAVTWVRQAWQRAHPGEAVATLGLGDSPNDLALLGAVDEGVVIPGPRGPHPQLAAEAERAGWAIAPYPGARGWAAVVEQRLDCQFSLPSPVV